MTRIRPIVIYPFRHPENTEHLKALYLSLDNKQRTESERYLRPVTVVNRQTYYRNLCNQSFLDMYEAAKQWSSILVDAWCVDTCQMWLAGFGVTFDDSRNSEVSSEDGDVSWLIPGDFDYATETGKKVLDKLYLIPEAVLTKADFCLGQLEMHPNSSKHLIDTYGTYGLLFNWFPAEAYEMRKNSIIRPRSEFFAIHHRFLRGALVDHRWFAYEQTVALLLQAGGRDLSTVSLGGIADPSESRDSLTGALQQIERTERVLKVAWRDQKIKNRVRDWVKEFRMLEEQSKEIIRAAMTILENSL
jgi:hypothetical protein